MADPPINTTIPSNPQYLWMGEPKQRGTFGIVSFCFSTLIICIWSTLHFNIPIRRYTITRRFFLQVLWMILTLLAPEGLLYLAFNERMTAGVLLEKVRKHHPHLIKPGLRARMEDWISGRVKWQDWRYVFIGRQSSQPHFGLVHSFYAIMGGFAFYGSYGDNNPTAEESLFQISTNPRHPVEVPTFDTLIYIMKHFPNIITDITEDYILNQSASSSLSKALLVVQVGWFCTNCASRSSQGLTVSLLEVSTATHAFCTLLTYFVWWSKPLNVAAPTLLREKEAREVYALLKCSHYEYERALEMAQQRAAGDPLTLVPGNDGLQKIALAANALQHLLPTPERPPPDSRFKDHVHILLPDRYEHLKSGLLMTALFLYGLLHLVGANDAPTETERILWCLSSIAVACMGLCLPGCMDVLVVRLGLYRKVHTYFYWIFVIHIIGSLFLMVESFRQLFFLDPTAYQLTSWSNYWPHFS